MGAPFLYPCLSPKIWELVRINCLELGSVLSIRLCVVYMFIYKITWLSTVIYFMSLTHFLVQLGWIRNRKEAAGREKKWWGRRLQEKGDMTVTGKNPSLKRKVFTASEKLKVPGTEGEYKKRKSQCLLNFLLQRRLQDLCHRTWSRKKEAKGRWGNLLSEVLYLFLFSVLKYTLNTLLALCYHYCYNQQ